MKSIKHFVKNKLMVLSHVYATLINGKDDSYGDIGLFVKNNPITNRYTYANWGSRIWEICLLEKWLKEINIKDKLVVDLGIGLPSDSDFYKFYIESKCSLAAYDPDLRLNGKKELSEKCVIYNKSSEDMSELLDNSVDVVVALSSLEHYPIEAFNNTLKEVNRILKKDGHFLVTLDLTFNKENSAKWAILEKTLNGLPSEENDNKLNKDSKHLTLNEFINMVSTFFYLKNYEIKNKDLNKDRFVYSERWNSYIAYIHLYKK